MRCSGYFSPGLRLHRKTRRAAELGEFLECRADRVGSRRIAGQDPFARVVDLALAV